MIKVSKEFSKQRGHTADLRSENAKKATGDLISYKLE